MFRCRFHLHYHLFFFFLFLRHFMPCHDMLRALIILLLPLLANTQRCTPYAATLLLPLAACLMPRDASIRYAILRYSAIPLIRHAKRLAQYYCQLRVLFSRASAADIAEPDAAPRAADFSPTTVITIHYLRHHMLLL